MPMFRKPNFYQQYYAGNLPKDLLLAMFAVSVRFSTKPSTLQFFGIDLRHAGDVLASQANRSTSEWFRGSAIDLLHGIKREAILVYHALSSTPSLRIADRSGRLVRLAHAYGLHQVDNPGSGQCILCSESTTPAEKEEMRHVWWCIYSLDSLCSRATGMPSNVVRDDIFTAMVSSNTDQLTSGDISISSRIFLETNVKRLGPLMQEAYSRSVTRPFHTCLLISSLLQDIYSTHRLAWLSPNFPAVESQMSTLKASLASIKESIPASMLLTSLSSPDLAGHLSGTHQSQLQFQLFLCLSDVLLQVPVGLRFSPIQTYSQQRRNDWAMCRHSSEDFLTLIKQWDSRYFLSVSPFISLAVWTVATLILVYEKVKPPPDPPPPGKITTKAFAMLDLFLMTSGNHWWLSKILSGTYLFLPLLPSPGTSLSTAPYSWDPAKPLYAPTESIKRFREDLKTLPNDLDLESVQPLLAQILAPLNPKYHIEVTDP